MFIICAKLFQIRMFDQRVIIWPSLSRQVD